ncbi:hypothetical protein BT96DRAFT_836010 [Gymnopus androsaceus JB14]|uniref:DDE Tnp4 domain-containing protein n=1 Tax=Gymnopus androsaceus JB14 TaxID=1447944 RepID=A0A6A4GS64_9AGAR|nr:hypothetical protein BT96DRAFT_836010 [Gymnopus androsaceus JB14]
MYRIGRQTFDTFVEILQCNPILKSRGQKPQRHVQWQLGCFLICYGQLGSPAHDTMLKMGIGYGTVILYCRRVTRALRETFATWLNEKELQESTDAILAKVGFPNCAGSGNGSLIQSLQPSWMGLAYLSRKGFFALAIQAIVNHGIWFASWELGWPGSVTDSRIFKNSHFWQHRDQYLKYGQYILVDKGYPSTPYTV